MSVGLSSLDNVKELAALAGQLDKLYDTALTKELIDLVYEVGSELRELHCCQYCSSEATRWLCDKPHTDN